MSKHVKVKPLEWRGVKDGRYAGGYRPNHYRSAGYEIAKTIYGWRIDDGHFSFLRKVFGTLDDAKGAAQEHHESRILSALEPSPAFEAMVEALEEILDYGGGADNALEDDYVLDRARTALALARGER